MAAVSYDSGAILKDFAERHNIDFPLLADPNSEIIRKLKVLNAKALGRTGDRSVGFTAGRARGELPSDFEPGPEARRYFHTARECSWGGYFP